MTKDEMNECVAMLGKVTGFLLASVPSSATIGIIGSQFRLDVGTLMATAADQLVAQTDAVSLYTCFEDARLCGCDLPHMRNIRSQIAALTPSTPKAILLVEMALVFALSETTQIIQAMTFTARDQVDTLLLNLQHDFGVSIEQAADRLDSTTFQALTALHASIVRYLVVTAQPLPLLTTYTFAQSFPTLVISQHLYGDASSADDILAQNHIVHPAFCPRSGRALAAS